MYILGIHPRYGTLFWNSTIVPQRMNDPGGVEEFKEKEKEIILSYGECSTKIKTKTSFLKWIIELIACV